MTTVVGVMDRPGWASNTDVMVLADPGRRRLTWVPRDLWCPRLGDRVNRAFALAGEEGLRSALAEHGLRADHSLIVAREAAEAFLDRLRVTVPVEREMSFWYPLAPQRPIAEGRRKVTFGPPAETLEGDRLHAWLGARYGVDRASSDLERIARQQQFLAALLLQGESFSPLAQDAEAVRASGAGALEDLALVAPGWRLHTLGPLRRQMIEGLDVLVPAD